MKFINRKDLIAYTQRNIISFFFLLFACSFVFLLTFSKSSGVGVRFFYYFQWIIGGDKSLHMLSSGLITFSFHWFLYNAYQSRTHFLICLLFILSVFSLEEIAQIFFPSRQFDLADLSASALGVVLVSIPFYFSFRKRE
ncbi:VanZ family protein [Motilimonas sp. 1_MG-2023]|uniref:VanZ family protein n=1 Tax=Motilimonas sp. 1_MG-2023 TaxID=3062672 RepID=UPI0026E49173|nr:VanZ family protein [Motilimonas sp. 1_MG-2023]MDO6526638.1 VanZ family protein [Motilimonas sp. 1_MG-2023]